MPGVIDVAVAGKTALLTSTSEPPDEKALAELFEEFEVELDGIEEDASLRL